MLLLGQDGPSKEKLLTGSILIDKLIHDYLGRGRVQIHITASTSHKFYDGSIGLHVSHQSEELIIAKNVFQRAPRNSEHICCLAEVAERFIVSACFTMGYIDLFWKSRYRTNIYK
jgi:hypothetical protein